MAKKRMKAAAVAAPATLQDAERMLGEIGELQRRVVRIETDMNEILADVKTKHEELAQPLNEKIETLFRGVHAYAEAHRKSLLVGDSKTVRLSTGLLLWRKTPPAVNVSKKNVETVIAWLKSAGLSDLVRTKEEINKEGILGDPTRVENYSLIRIKQTEEFVAKPFESQIERTVTLKNPTRKTA